MRILIYGAGVIGSLFAAKLSASGQDVTLLARGKRLEELRQNGIVLSSPGDRKEEIIPVKCIDHLAPDDVYDFVLVALQRTQVDSVLPFLSQNRSHNIVFIVNTAAGYEQWAQAIGSGRLMLGFPSAGGERVNGKVVYFLGKGFMRAFQTTTFSEYNGSRSKQVRTIIRAFRKAGIPSVFCSDMDAWQKTHVAMVTSIANALYKFDCDNFRLAKSYPDIRLMIQGIKEGIAVLKKLKIRPRPAKLGYFSLPTFITASVFQWIMGTKLAEITMAKHCVSARLELLCLQAEFDTLILQSKLKTPSIDKLRSYLLSK